MLESSPYSEKNRFQATTCQCFYTKILYTTSLQVLEQGKISLRKVRHPTLVIACCLTQETGTVSLPGKCPGLGFSPGKWHQSLPKWMDGLSLGPQLPAGKDRQSQTKGGRMQTLGATERWVLNAGVCFVSVTNISWLFNSSMGFTTGSWWNVSRSTLRYDCGKK